MHEKIKKNADDALTLIRCYNLLLPADRVLLVWHKLIITEICQQMSSKITPDDVFLSIFQKEVIERRS